MLFSTILFAGLVSIAAASPALIARDDTPDPKSVYIDSVKFAGTGCPVQSTITTLGENATLINLSFSEYVAQNGPWIDKKDNRKNCNVNLKLHYPQGWTYTVATTDFRGYVALDQTCYASLGADFWFSGQQVQAHVLRNLTGPVEGHNYRETVAVGTSSLVWSQCGVTGPLLNINSQALVRGCKNNDSGVLQVDAQDTKFKIVLKLQWKKC